MAFAFGDLLEDIGRWLLLGIFLAGLITVFISPEFIETWLGDGIFSMLVMVGLATPLYVCATASTPIAAALALKGLSPGAALVFLLAGPATNIATVTVVSRLLGKRATVIYLLTIIGCSFLLGIAANELYAFFGIDITGWVQSGHHDHHGIVPVITSVVLIVLVLKSFLPRSAKHNHHNGDVNGLANHNPVTLNRL